MPALGGPRLVTGRVHEPTEFRHRDFKAPDRETTLELHPVARLLFHPGVGGVGRCAHLEAAMGHHHQGGPAPPRFQRIAEDLARTEQAVVADQVDPLAQRHADLVAGPGDAQDFGQPLARILQIGIAQRHQAFVTQSANAVGTNCLDARACRRNGGRVMAHGIGPRHLPVGAIEIPLHGALQSAIHQCLFHRGQACRRARRARPQRLRPPERLQGPARHVQPPGAQRGCAGIAQIEGLPGAVHVGQIHLHIGQVRPQHAQHAGHPLRIAQCRRVLAGRQRHPRLRQQCQPRLFQQSRIPGILGLQLAQRQQQRDGRLRGFEQIAARQRPQRRRARTPGGIDADIRQ